MPTSQQQADLALHQWQSMRDLVPTEHIERLMDFYAPFNSEQEYLETLELLSREMSDV